MTLENNINKLDTQTGTVTQQATPQTGGVSTSSSSTGSVFINEQETAQASQSQTKTSGSGSVFTDAKNQTNTTESATNNNVNTKKKHKKEKDFTEKELIDFVNSLDKSLPEKEKIKLLKKHFAIKDKKEIADIIRQAEMLSIKAHVEKQINNDVGKIIEHSKEIAYERLNEAVYVDALIRSGKTKTEAEKDYKTYINSGAGKTSKKAPEQPLVTDEELTSPEWKNKSFDEKIDTYMALHLERNDEGYAKLSDEEKAAYRQKEILKLDKYFKKINKGIGLDNASGSKQFTMLSKYINILETLNKKELSLDKFLTFNLRRQEKFIKETIHDTSLNNVIDKANNIKELIPEERRNSEEWKKLSKNEKLYIYTDAILTKKDPEYAKLSPEGKKEYIKTKSNDFLDLVLGDLSKELSTNDLKKEKEKLVEIAAQCLELAEQGKLTKKELDNITYSTMAKEMDHETVEAFNDIIAENPNASIKELKQAVRKNDSISGSQKNAMLKTLRHLENLDSKCIVYEKKNYHKIARQNNCDNIEEFITKYVTKETSIEEITQLAQNISSKEILILKAQLEKLGFDEKFITKTLSSSRNHNLAVAMVNEDGAEIEEELHCQNNYCGDREGVIQRRELIFKSVELSTTQEITLKAYNRADKEYSKDTSLCLNNVFEPETVIQIQKNIAKSDDVSDAGKAIAAETIIETAKNDEIRVKYSEELSKETSASYLEGLAAGSKYVTEPNYKTQYESNIQIAANNFPPETQNVIKNAIKTGKVSQETLSRTTPPSESSTKTASSSQDSTKSAQQNPNKSGTNQTLPGKTPVNQSSPNPRSTQIPNLPEKTAGLKTVSTTPVSKAYTPEINTDYGIKASSVPKTSSVQNRAETAALEAKRDAVGEKILAYQEHVKESNIDRILNEYLSASESQIIENVIAAKDSNIPAEVREKFKQIIAKNNINAIYDIITSKFGGNAKEKFLEALAKYGSSESVSSFANDRKNDITILKTLYLKCTNQMVKSELLRMLPEDTIYQMISDGIIANLNDIDTKILKKFLLKNGSIMSNSKFASYRKYFSLDDWTKILDERNTNRGITSAQTKKSENAPEQTDAYAQNPMQLNNATQEVQPTKQQAEDIPDTRFKAGETVKTLSDGTVITNQGTTFAGISNNVSDDTFRVIEKPKQKEGAPIGMNDEILTPGSEEWKLKYNKQQEPPKTAFTMASMDEDEDDFGMPFGSNKVGMGTKINKKFPKGMKFNA